MPLPIHPASLQLLCEELLMCQIDGYLLSIWMRPEGKILPKLMGTKQATWCPSTF